MHIEFEFTGDIEQITDQYLEHLDMVKNWSKLNEIESKIAYSDGVLIVFLPDLDSYCLWVSTVNLAYKLVRNGYES